jgi:DNA (cytosine-5)-methyltransferase 1
LTSSARTVHTATSIARFAATPQGEVEPVSRFLRLAEDGLCNTLRAGTGAERGAFTSPRPIHPRLARVISVREAARLHSFPDWFRLHATKWNGFRQIGNAVPPRLGRALGGAIVRALELELTKPTTVLEPGDDSLLRLAMKDAAAQVGAHHGSIPLSRRRSQERQIAGLW